VKELMKLAGCRCVLVI